MSRITSIKITDPKPCKCCGRIMNINEWAQALPGGELHCSNCVQELEAA